MVVFKEFTVEIRTGGVELPTFDDPEIVDGDESEPNTITKFIQASANSEFTVFATCSPTFTLPHCDSIVYSVTPDGVYLDNLRKIFGNAATSELTGLQSTDSAGRWMTHPLRFGPVATFEGSAYNQAHSDPARYAELGCIKVVVQGFRMTVLAQPIATLKDLPSGNEMPEKFLKKSAADLGTGVAEARHLPTPPFRCQGVWVGSPLATFRFLYRSKDTLQMLGIVPRSPTPLPLEERPVEQLSVEELHELVRRQRAHIIQNQENIKKEDGMKPTVKSEEHDQAAGDLVSDNETSSDVEIVEVSVSKKRKIEVVELSDGE